MDKFSQHLLNEIKKRREASKSIKGGVGFTRSHAFIDGMEEALRIWNGYNAMNNTIAPARKKITETDITY